MLMVLVLALADAAAAATAAAAPRPEKLQGPLKAAILGRLLGAGVSELAKTIVDLCHTDTPVDA